MPFAYWCVLIAALLPYVLAGIAKSDGRVDNHDPRGADYKGFRRRALNAHQNSFETFPFFAAAVIIAVTQGAPLAAVNVMAGLYILARIGYAGLYLANQATVRSIIWGVGMLLNVAIFVSPLWR